MCSISSGDQSVGGKHGRLRSSLNFMANIFRVTWMSDEMLAAYSKEKKGGPFNGKNIQKKTKIWTGQQANLGPVGH